MYLNKAFLYGNLTRDPELKALPSGIKVANFAIATNRTYKDKGLAVVSMSLDKSQRTSKI
jgi:single-stranded DNA-binding protein